MIRILLVADSHLMNHPRDLSSDQIRKQWSPFLMMRKWVPLFFVSGIIRLMRHSALKMLGRLHSSSSIPRCDYLITVGDQVHGIAEKGIAGLVGKIVMKEFLGWCRGLTAQNTLFHVSSEHPLGYWEGEDYFPYLTWKNGRPRLEFVIHRDIGGHLSEEAIENWEELCGPLWGVKEVGGFRLVWINCDLWRWQKRIIDSKNPFLINLLFRQDEFLQITLEDSPPNSVILFSHRIKPVMENYVARLYKDRIKAVVFADFHAQSVYEKWRRTISDPGFRLCFVPALWGVQFGFGKPGCAIMEINGSEISFQTYALK